MDSRFDSLIWKVKLTIYLYFTNIVFNKITSFNVSLFIYLYYIKYFCHKYLKNINLTKMLSINKNLLDILL